jgi:hypothetical protein
MVTKFKYFINEKGLVARTPDYSFTAIEELSSRLAGIDNQTVISSIANTTLKGESERALIEAEDTWFKVQSGIQSMDTERKALELKLKKGDKNGNPLTPAMQANVAARIAELKEGTITVKKEFYNHYTRQTMTVDEVIQTPYTIALENRTDLEATNGFLAGLRGVSTAPARPTAVLDTEKETAIRKELVRQQIDIQVGDDKDLIADMSKALSALIKKVNGTAVSSDEEASISKYTDRQAKIADIMAADYIK